MLVFRCDLVGNVLARVEVPDPEVWALLRKHRPKDPRAWLVEWYAGLAASGQIAPEVPYDEDGEWVDLEGGPWLTLEPAPPLPPARDLTPAEVRARAAKVVTSMYLEPHQAEELKALSDRSHVPMAEFLREAVDLVLKGQTPFARLHGVSPEAQADTERADRMAALGEELER